MALETPDKVFNHAMDVAEDWTAQEVLRWAFDTYASSIAIATACGAEGMVVLDIATKIEPKPNVFTLDTGFFFTETRSLIEDLEKRYAITIERVQPEYTPNEQAEVYGPSLWSKNPDICCRMRKIEPLKKKLANFRAWVTGIRREQSLARSEASKVEWDSKFGLTKINPLIDWSEEMVWDYIRKHKLIYNPLHDRGYPSIGCTHCTRPVQPGEDRRAGRWSGLGKTECGLHDLGK
jgi:phosphoadenosine phosphosulfate reductase